jgi:uncharacterized protein YceH (UPF0502 family)
VTPNLNEIEARIVGCLIEKSIVTPSQYPLTLNALLNACNQRSGRNPIMELRLGELQNTLRSLEIQSLTRKEENFKSRAEKFVHRFCNTRYSELQFDPAQLAIVCLLLLRGPQTPGEIRARSGRLFEFADNDSVVVALNELMNNEGDPTVVQLPRTLGRKDSEYMHLFSGPVDLEKHAADAAANHSARSDSRITTAELEQRVAALEEEVAMLKARLDGVV